MLSVALAPPWREYLLYVPRNFETLKHPSLVVWIHGCRQDPEAFAAGTRIARFADERGFIVLLPRQTGMANSERCWNWFDRRTARGNWARPRSSPRKSPRSSRSSASTRGAFTSPACRRAPRSPRRSRCACPSCSPPPRSIPRAVPARRSMRMTPAVRWPKGRATTGPTRSPAEARAAAGAEARMPALVIQARPTRRSHPVNAVFLVRQFLLFNGLEELPPGAALPPALTRAVHPRAADYVMSEYYAGRRLAARLMTIPGLGHAWSGGDSAFEYCDERYPDATALVCDFFDAHRRRS